MPLDGISFLTNVNARMWKYLVNTRITMEKELLEQAQDNIEFMELLAKANLVQTVLKLGPYYPWLVLECLES